MERTSPKLRRGIQRANAVNFGYSAIAMPACPDRDPSAGPSEAEENAAELPLSPDWTPSEGPELLDEADHEADDGEETQGLTVPTPDEDLGGLDAEAHDELEVVLEAIDPNELLHVVERAAGDDDDEPGPATAHDGEDGADELGSLEAEHTSEEDDATERHAEDPDLAELDHDARDEDAGAEGIAGEDPSAAIEEAPAIDGADGEGEGLGEALPELDERPRSETNLRDEAR